MYRDSVLEKLEERIRALLKENAVPFTAAMAAGLASYLYCFTNKLEIMDDLACMFYHGDSVSSGRWGLELTARFLPGFSLPWLNGLLSIVMLSAAICVAVKMSGIKGRLLKILLAAAMMSFPSQTCTFAYMFAAPHYALSLLMAAASAYFLTQAFCPEGDKLCKPSSEAALIKRLLLPSLLLIFSLSIYQAYLSVTVSLVIVYAFIQTLSEERSGRSILRCALLQAAAVAVSVLVYYLVTAAVKKITGTGLNRYAEENLTDFKGALFGLRVAYTAFLGYFYRGYYDLILPGASRAANILLVAVSAVMAVEFFAERRNREGNRGRMLTALLCLALLPAGVNCLRIISTTFHNLMLFSFTSVYVLAAAILERCGGKKLPGLCSDAVLLALAVIACVNISFANSVYLKMDIQFKQAESFYTGLLARLSAEEGFNKDSLVCIVGDNDGLYDIPAIPTDNLSGIREGIIGTYSQRAFIRYFVGYDLKIADTDITDILEQDERVAGMPQYPFSGSIRNIDGAFVVKVGPVGGELD